MMVQMCVKYEPRSVICVSEVLCQKCVKYELRTIVCVISVWNMNSEKYSMVYQKFLKCDLRSIV